MIRILYREHKWLKQPDGDTSGDIRQQLDRWDSFISQWEAASGRADTFVIGDTNLDYNKWNDPDPDHTNMTDLVKNIIETLGFVQTVRGDTRFWPGADSFLVDQCWTDCPARIVRASNNTRASSDHNVQEVQIRVAGSVNNQKEIILRDKSKMNWDIIKEEASKIDWGELLSCNNLDIVNNIFESNIRDILDRQSPVISRKIKMKNKIWISSESLDEMKVRYAARERAAQTQLPTDWETYRKSKNKCTRLNIADKRRHFEQTFSKVKSGQDVQKLYRKVKTQLGWTSGGPPQALIIDGKLNCASKPMADALMDHYTNKISKLKQNLPGGGISPTVYLEDRIRKWGARAANRPLFNLRQISLIETVDLIKTLGTPMFDKSVQLVQSVQ